MMPERRAQIVAEARRWIGTPYMHQASLLGTGADCLGLVRGVWRAVVGPEPERVPPYTPDWAEASGADALLQAGQRHFVPVPRDQFQAGDILLFRWRAGVPAKHLAIASGPSAMIHAHDGACVCEVAIVPQWRRRLVAAFAFPETVS